MTSGIRGRLLRKKNTGSSLISSVFASRRPGTTRLPATYAPGGQSRIPLAGPGRALRGRTDVGTRRGPNPRPRIRSARSFRDDSLSTIRETVHRHSANERLPGGRCRHEWSAGGIGRRPVFMVSSWPSLSTNPISIGQIAAAQPAQPTHHACLNDTTGKAAQSPRAAWRFGAVRLGRPETIRPEDVNARSVGWAWKSPAKPRRSWPARRSGRAPAMTP